MNLSRNCTPGCQCPHGTVQQVGEVVNMHTHIYSEHSHVVDGPAYYQDGVCVRESDCRCDVDGQQYRPGDTVPTDCNNWYVKLTLKFL